MGRLRVNVFGTKHLRSQNTMLLTRLRSHTRLLNSAYLFWKHPRQFPVVEARRELLHETTREGRTKRTRTIHPSTFSTRYFLSLGSRGWAGASASCHRVAAEWHPGQVQTPTRTGFFPGRTQFISASYMPGCLFFNVVNVNFFPNVFCCLLSERCCCHNVKESTAVNKMTHCVSKHFRKKLIQSWSNHWAFKTVLEVQWDTQRNITAAAYTVKLDFGLLEYFTRPCSYSGSWIKDLCVPLPWPTCWAVAATITKRLHLPMYFTRHKTEGKKKCMLFIKSTVHAL